MQRVGAQVADHGDALLRHVRPGSHGRRVFVVASAGRRTGRGPGAVRGFGGLLRLGQPVGDGLHLAGARVDVVPDQVGLAGLAVDALGLLRQLALAVVVHRQQRAALRQVVLQPLLLGAEEPLDVGGVAAVLARRGEQVVLPDDAVSLRQIVAEFGGRGRHAALGERAGDLMPGDVGLALLRLVLLPDLRLFLARGRRDVRSCSSFGMLPSAITSSIGGCRCASSLRRRTVRTGSASASPMACSFQPCASSRSIARQMSTLDIEARIRFSATERIASAASSASHTSTSIDRQLGLDRRLHPAVADDDHQPVVLRGHARRLDDADRLDRGEQLFVHRRRHRRAAGIVRIGLEGTGIDAAKFGHGWLL